MNEKSPRNHRFRGLLLIGLQLECEIRFYAPDILCILSNRAGPLRSGRSLQC